MKTVAKLANFALIAALALSATACDDETTPPGLELELKSVSPLSSSERGGVKLTLKGQAFKLGTETDTQITVGGADCTDIEIASATQLTCVTSARVPGGSLPITMIDEAGDESTLEGVFAYYPTGKQFEFAMPTAGSKPSVLAAGADGNVWYMTSTVVPRQMGRVTPEGVITEYVLPAEVGHALALVAGRDGNLWFTDDANHLGKFALADQTTTLYPAPGAGALAVGGDGNLWVLKADGGSVSVFGTDGAFVTSHVSGADPATRDLVAVASNPREDGPIVYTTLTGQQIVRMDSDGSTGLYDLSNAISGSLTAIAHGTQGYAWVTAPTSNHVARIQLRTGEKGRFLLPTADARPSSIALGADGNMWFTETGASQIGRINNAGEILEFNTPSLDAAPRAIVAGADGNLWYVESDLSQIVKIYP